MSGTQARSSVQDGPCCGQNFKQRICLEQQEPNGGRGSSHTAWGTWHVPILRTMKTLVSPQAPDIIFFLFVQLF